MEIKQIDIYTVKDQGGQAEIYVTSKEGAVEFPSRVTVYAPGKRFGKSRVAEVNWSGCGSQGVSTTRQYANLILFAADYAELMPYAEEIA